MLIHSISSITIHRASFQFAVSTMSDQSDSQNRSEEQVNLSEGTSPSGSYDEGSKSTPSSLPKAATRQRRKRNSDSEDEDYVSAEEEVSSKKKVVKKEFGTTASTKPGMKRHQPKVSQCPKPEPQHRKPLSSLLNQRRLFRARRGRKGSRIPWPG